MMANPYWSGERSRHIVRRIIVEGDLILQTPSHFGNGDSSDLLDMPLLVDPHDNKTPLLTGASIAGALRSYLRQTSRVEDSILLFGGQKEDDEGEQSPLIVEDAYGEAYGSLLRHGVRIEAASRTAAAGALYDTQLWQAGTRFPLRFELVIRATDNEAKMKQALATALAGLEEGRITLGARKSRGYGQVRAENWQVKAYNLRDSEQLLNWLEQGGTSLSGEPANATIKDALGVANLLADRRHYLEMEAAFILDGSLLIRSGQGKDDVGPDTVHLHARQADGTLRPILSGTSLAGVLRARALKIANTLSPAKASSLVDGLFGGPYKDPISGEPKLRASRVVVRETAVGTFDPEKPGARADLVQNRVSIDRFTGGARETALFDEQPVWGNENTKVKIHARLNEPAEHEIGLLLLLLKDLWTGDLPLGGESSVGRGRLRGQKATLTHHNGTTQTWTITTAGDALQFGKPEDATTLQGYVDKLITYLQEGES